MAKKIIQLPEITTPSEDAKLLIVDNPTGLATNSQISLPNLAANFPAVTPDETQGNAPGMTGPAPGLIGTPGWVFRGMKKQKVGASEYWVPYYEKLTDTNWWLAGGIDPADCEAAYRAVGAASYAASKVNLNNPGYKDLVDTGHAPTWTVQGWQFDGIAQYLDTMITNHTDEWSLLVRYNDQNWPTKNMSAFLIGAHEYGDRLGISIFNDNDTKIVNRYEYAGDDLVGGNAYFYGVRVLTNHIGYSQGERETPTAYNYLNPSFWNGYGTQSIAIGCQNLVDDSPYNFWKGKIEAAAIYKRVLTPTEIFCLSYAAFQLKAT